MPLNDPFVRQVSYPASLAVKRRAWWLREPDIVGPVVVELDD
jgi:hypothetical protein